MWKLIDDAVSSIRQGVNVDGGLSSVNTPSCANILGAVYSTPFCKVFKDLYVE